MENYDVIIVGAGIAGTGLAYNLSKICPEKTVLIIDQSEPGANAAYGYRNTTEEIVKEYHLPYEHIYKGVKIGTADKTYFTLEKKFYFINYKKVCKFLLKKSDHEFKKEEALNINNSILTTNKNNYKYKILIDCSGHNFFAKKLFNQKLPFRYWIGKTKVLKNKLKKTDYYYFQFSDSGYQEDFYPLKNRTLQGDWQYVKKIDFNLITPDKKNLYKSLIKNSQIIRENKTIIPCTPVFPLVYKNIAFLGNSFGNPTTSSAEGIRASLNSSKILTTAIKKRNLKLYENVWKTKYLETYLRYLVTKLDSYHNPKWLQNIKKIPTREGLLPTISKYPDVFEKILMCESDFRFPEEIKKMFPKRSKIFQAYYYLYLKSKYTLMQT